MDREGEPDLKDLSINIIEIGTTSTKILEYNILGTDAFAVTDADITCKAVDAPSPWLIVFRRSLTCST
jgi:hypothetical protein